MVLLTENKRGMMLAEIILAGAVISLALMSAVAVVGGLQSVLSNAQNSFEAQIKAREITARASLMDFNKISSFKESDGFFTTNFSVSHRNSFTTNISADVSWFEGTFQKHRFITNQITDWKSSYGAESCDWLDSSKGILAPINFGVLNIDEGNPITDMAVLGDYAYVSADSATSSLADIYVIDVQNIQKPKIVSSLNTGPGIASIATFDHYIFVANAGSYQMQIIDVADPLHPALISQAKLQGAVISGTSGFGQSIHFFDNKIYIGLIKNAGPEFYIVDVSNPKSPILLGSYEIGSTVNDIDVQNGVAALATPGQNSVFLLNTANPNNISEISRTTFTGWQTQGAQSLEMLGSEIYVGRTLGGFYSPYPEYVYLNTNNISGTNSATSTIVSSLKIGASIEGILKFNDYSYFVTSDAGATFQILKNTADAVNTTNTASTTDAVSTAGIITFTKSLSSRGIALACNSKAMYVVTQSGQDFFHIFYLP